MANTHITRIRFRINNCESTGIRYWEALFHPNVVFSVAEKGTATGVFSVFGVVRVMLEPSNTVGPPAGTHSVGELHVDSNAVLYFRVGSGTPGKWKIVQLQE